MVRGWIYPLMRRSGDLCVRLSRFSRVPGRLAWRQRGAMQELSPWPGTSRCRSSRVRVQDLTGVLTISGGVSPPDRRGLLPRQRVGRRAARNRQLPSGLAGRVPRDELSLRGRQPAGRGARGRRRRRHLRAQRHDGRRQREADAHHGPFGHGLADPDAGDYTLKPGSPCTNSGNPVFTDPDFSPSEMGLCPYDPWTHLGGGIETVPWLAGVAGHRATACAACSRSRRRVTRRLRRALPPDECVIPRRRDKLRWLA